MKTDDFIKQVTDMGYEIYKTKYWIYVVKNDTEKVAEVSRSFRYGMGITPQKDHLLYPEPTRTAPEELVDLVIEYASTPIEERYKKGGNDNEKRSNEKFLVLYLREN